MSILFSPIGESDPIRNYYDGPLLHILRYYKDINKVYLFFTKRMKDHREYIDRAVRETIRRDIDFHYINSEIVDAHDYNIFYNDFKLNITKIRNENPTEKFYINISSGTPQMSVALALIACQEKVGSITTIQVSRPCEDVKEGARVGTKKYNFEEEIFLNQDNDLEINRCRIVEITSILYNNLRERVKILVDRYDYSTALEVYNSSPILDLELQRVLAHLSNRIAQQYIKAIEFSKNTKYKEKLFIDILVNKKYQSLAPLLESFLVINILYKTNKINDFLIKLCSYCENLQKEVIRQLFGYDVEKRFCEKDGKRQITKREKIMNYSRELLQKLDDNFRGFFSEQTLSINAINIIIEYELEKAIKLQAYIFKFLM